MNLFLLNILREPWAMSPDLANTYLDAIVKITEGKLVFDGDKAEFEPRTLLSKNTTNPKATMATRRESGSGVGDRGTVALIPITSPMMKYDQECGPRGMITIGNYIKAAAVDPRVGGIILFLDTPGGTVAGTQALGDLIKSVEKPIFAFVSDMAASAGYWIASCCDMIIAENTNTQVGSIGVMSSMQDIQPALEKMGVVFHTIKSSLSDDKNALSDEVRKGDYENYRTTVLDPLARTFIDTVKASRGAKIKDESIYKGRMAFATEAIELGMIDKIASLDETVEMVLSFDKKPKQNNSKPKSSMKNFPLMLAALGLTALEADAEGYVSLNQEQLAAIEANMLAAQTAAQKASDDLTAATTAADTLTASVSAKDAEILQLKAEKKAILDGAAASYAALVVEKEVGADSKHADLAAIENMTEAERFVYMKEHGY